MIRAEGGALIEAFEEKEIVALGWDRIPDLSLVTSRDQVRDLYSSAYPDHAAGKQTNAIAMLFKFRVQVSQDDSTLTGALFYLLSGYTCPPKALEARKSRLRGLFQPRAIRHIFRKRRNHGLPFLADGSRQ